MKSKTRFAMFCGLILVLGVGAGSWPAAHYWRRLVAPQFRGAAVSRGSITTFVRATGTVRPVVAVQVGAFVSGPIAELKVDFDDQVKKGDLLARIDARIYEGDVARDRAALEVQRAEVNRIMPLLTQAERANKRGLGLQQDNEDFISETELDKLKYTHESLTAQLQSAKAAVQLAEAKVKNSLANLEYTEIRSPVDGVVIDRKIDLGQTVVATFATPILFVVAPDLAGEMHIFAKVDEADIGLLREAQQANRAVHFTVDAYPDDEFTGRVKQIRSNSSALESVVTFPVVVTTTNPDRKLLPGMTANLVFETSVKENILRIPNTAIRFYPPADYVREEDRRLLDPERAAADSEREGSGVEGDSAGFGRRGRNRRHVWVAEGHLLRAVEVTVGISDEQFTEIVSDNLQEGEEVVTDIES